MPGGVLDQIAEHLRQVGLVDFDAWLAVKVGFK